MSLINNLPVTHFISLSVAADPKQSEPSQVEETLSAEDRTGGQRRDLPTQRTLHGTPGQVRVCGEVLMQ